MISGFDGKTPRIHPTAFVHDRATVIGDVEIGAGSSVWPGAVIRGDFGSIKIGERTSIQDNAVIHTSMDRGTVIGNDCIIAHLAFLESADVGDMCMVAVSAVLHTANMRTGSVAAAGAVLVGDIEVPSGHRAQGVPARIVPLAEPMDAYIKRGADHYVEIVERYRAEAGAPR